MVDTVRSFIAIDITGDIRRSVRKAQDDLGLAPCRVSWIDPGNFHLTLKFLGDVDSSDLVGIAGIMGDAAADVEPFELVFSRVGTFPGGRPKPRVVWIGVEDAAGATAKIVERLDEGLIDFDIEPESRAYMPHLTIGRVRSQKGAPDLAKRIAAWEGRHFGRMTVASIALYRSELTPRGPIHTQLDTVNFRED